MKQSERHSEGSSAACSVFGTPWGDGWFRLEGDALVEVTLPAPGEGEPPAGCGSGSESRAVLDWRSALEGYFSRPETGWGGLPVGLDHLVLTPFQRAVYEALMTVPSGETIGYGELAALAGYPGAARAVGSAMAANPLPLVVPCHRVIRADGSLGRYGRCDAYKEQLLRLEGAVLEPPEDEA